MNNYLSGNEELPETTVAQDALIKTFSSAPPDASIVEEDEEEEEEEEEEKGESAISKITDFVEEIADVVEENDDHKNGSSCC